MPSHVRNVIWLVVSVALLMILTLGLRVGGENILRAATFSPLLGALIGGILVLVSVSTPPASRENTEPWLGNERLGWILIGCGCIGWAIGECFWRYYVSQGQAPFPSLADFGYSSFSPLVFLGLTLQPSSKRDRKRMFLVLDSLIAMGALLSIAWFLLLGNLVQAETDSVFVKVLALYYPTADVALLSYIAFLLIRGTDPIYQAPPRRVGLLVLGLGLSVFAISDFLFNILINNGVPVDGQWNDLGWPLGMMMIGVAVYVRRFLSANVTEHQRQESRKPSLWQQSTFVAQAVPYVLLSIQFLALAINVLSSDPTQQSFRPVLIIATFLVIALLVARQIITIRENERLVRETQKIVELEAAEIRRQEEQLVISRQIEEGIQQIITTMGMVVTRNDYGIRVPMSQENILWRVSMSINNLLSRLQGLRHGQEELKRTHAIAAEVAQRIRNGLPVQLTSWTGTAFDAVIMEYNNQLQNTPERRIP